MTRFFSLLFLLMNLSLTKAQNDSNLSVSPNPFYSSATINFQLNNSETVTLQVLNKNGNLVKDYFNSTLLQDGSYSLNFSGDNLDDDVYFVSLVVGGNTTTKKLVKDVKSVGILKQNSVKQNFIFYPNPSNSTITFSIEGIKNIIITDLNGRVLKNETTSKNEISIVDLTKGQYFVTILSAKQEIIAVQKLIKVE